VADYPRIVVGEELLKYLEVTGPRVRGTEFGQLVESIASHVRRFIKQDGDGMWMLDFLGENLVGNPEIENRRILFTRAKKYIEDQQGLAYDQQDYKHLSRYFRLGSYFETRAKGWNAKNRTKKKAKPTT